MGLSDSRRKGFTLVSRSVASRIDRLEKLLRALGQLSQPPLQESAFRLLTGQLECTFEGSSGFRHASQASAQLAASRMSEPIILQVAPIENGVDQGETHGRAIPHRHRNGAVELDDRRRIGPLKDIIKTNDL